MGYTTTIILDKRKQKKDKTYPLVLKIIINRIPTTINLKRSFLATDWDESKNRVSKRYKGTQSVSRLNVWISQQQAIANEFLEQKLQKRELSKKCIPELRSLLFGGKKQKDENATTFNDFTLELINQMKAINKTGNAQVYTETLNSINEFCHQMPLSFTTITYKWLTDYETYYLAKGNKINGLSVRMRTIRAIYNKAIKVGLAQQNDYPFKHYSIKTAETEHRALHIDDLQKIKQYQAVTDSEQRALDYFFISFYLRGMNFIDLAYCTVSQIKNGKIHYTRQKTNKPFVIQIPDIITAVLETYTANKKPNDYVFPIITHIEADAIRRQIKSKLRTTNKILKRIAAKLGLQETNITTYVARHTYATQAKKKGVPIAAISDMLGHKSLAITETYLDSFSNEELDSWSERVFE